MNVDDQEVQRALSKLSDRFDTPIPPLSDDTSRITSESSERAPQPDHPNLSPAQSPPGSRPLTPRPWDQPSATTLRAEQLQIWSESARKTCASASHPHSSNSRSSSFSGHNMSGNRLSSAGSLITSRTPSFITISCSPSALAPTQPSEGHRKLSFAVQFSNSPRETLIAPERETTRFSRTVKVDAAAPYYPVIHEEEVGAGVAPLSAAPQVVVEAQKKGRFAKLFKRKFKRNS